MTEFIKEVRQILKSSTDPFKVRKNTFEIVKNLEFITINPDKLSEFGKKLKIQIDDGSLLTSDQFGEYKDSSQHIFLLDVVNFCFWAGEGEDKWRVKYPEDKIIDGWEALVVCFDRALEEKIPLLEAKFLEKMTLDQVKHVFRSCNNAEIPLLKERLEFLQEAGSVLSSRFAGEFDNLIKEGNSDAVQIVKLIIKNFPSFNDVGFYKRAQICAYDLSLLPDMNIKNVEQLTIFADYKLPQILRALGVLEYKKSLAEKIDNYVLIDKNSREEREIRAVTIWVGELLAKRLDTMPVVIDNAIWYLTQKTNKNLGLYHRTLTTSY